MTFEQKYAEDEGKHYPWLLVSTVVPNVTVSQRQSSNLRLEHALYFVDHFQTLSVRNVFLYSILQSQSVYQEVKF
jgi:hypothetical protein